MFSIDNCSSKNTSLFPLVHRTKHDSLGRITNGISSGSQVSIWKHNDMFYYNDPVVLIPDLLNIQRASFQNFLLSGLQKVFEKKKKIVFEKGTHKLELIFFPEWIRFKKPELNTKKAIHLGKTYGCSVYIPVLVKFSGWKKNRLEWLVLGFLPLLTKQGHFIINGIPRVVLHQMIRNPGLYILANDIRTRVPTIRIVPKQGSWINLTIDKKYRLWIATRYLRRKVSLLIFLQALGLSVSEISASLSGPKKRSFLEKNQPMKESDYDNSMQQLVEQSRVKALTKNKKTRHDRILIRAGLKEHPRTQLEAQRYLYAHFLEYTSTFQTREQNVTEETAQEFFSKYLWNEKNRTIGPLGRKQFREKIGSSLSATEIQLTEADVCLATKALLNLICNEQRPDELDSLNNKRVRGCGEFLYENLNRGLQEFEGVLTRKFTNCSLTEYPTFWRLNRSILSKSISKSWKSFFTSGTLSQFMDQTNPLAEITHKRRLTVLGPGGVSGKQTTIQIRGIHPSYYGRLCPIETPEGQNAGLVSSFTVYTQRNSQGDLQTPFFDVYQGQVQKGLDVTFVLPLEESKSILAAADIGVSPWNQLPKTELPVRKNWNFEYALWNEIGKQAVNSLQMISVATSLIPFLEHDDANRALMGSNMQRQAVPLLKNESALVRTGLETRVVCDIHHGIRASQTGYSTRVSSNKIQLYTPKNSSVFRSKKTSFFWNKKNLFGSPSCLNKNSEFTLCKPKVQKQNKQQIFFRHLYSFSFSNKTNIFAVQSCFEPKLKFFECEADSKKLNFLERNLISVLNFSEKSGKRKNHSTRNNFLVSSLFNKQKVERQNKKNLIEKESSFLMDLYQRTNQSTCVTQKPFLMEGKWTQFGQLLADGTASSKGKLALGKNVLVAYLPWEGYNFEDAILISDKLVQQEIFTSLHIDFYEIEVKNTQYGLESITKNIPLEIDASSKDIFQIERLDSRGLVKISTWVEEGDYLVGKISPLTPKGPSVQQQYEKLYNVIMQRETTSFKNTSLRVPKGVEGFVLDVQVLPPKETEVLPLAPKDSILRVRVALLQKRNIQVGDKMAGRHGNKGVISKILRCQDMPYLPDGTPIDIVLNPLGVPSRMNVGQILEALLGLAGKHLQESYKIQLFDEKFGAEASRSLVYSKLYEASLKTSNPWLFEPQHPGKLKVFDGRTGETFDQPVTVGYAHMLKLIHLVDDKIHARATGPYSAVTQQPVRGRARNGGQRLGEMEVWALQAYSAAYTLQELLTVKSDDIDGRKDAVFRIYTNKPLNYGQPESFKVLLRELQSLCFDLQLSKYDEKTQTLVLQDLKNLENF